MNNIEFINGLGVWCIVERVDVDEKLIEQYTFVLASNVEEAIRIVGTDERREVEKAYKVCQLSQLPSDKYRPVEVLNLRKKQIPL